MENNSVKSLFTWVLNTKKMGRFLCSEFKTGLFHTLASDKEGAEPSHCWRCKVSPSNRSQLAGGRRGSPDMRQVPVWPVSHGSITRGVGAAWQRHQQELGNAPRVRGHIHSKRLESKKNMWKKIYICVGGKNDHLWEASTTQQSLSNRNTMWTPFSLGELLQTLSDHIYQKRRSRKGSGFCGRWCGFLNKGRKEIKVFYLGTNPLRCKHIPEEGKKGKVQKPGPNGHFSTGLWFQTWVDL